MRVPFVTQLRRVAESDVRHVLRRQIHFVDNVEGSKTWEAVLEEFCKGAPTFDGRVGIAAVEDKTEGCEVIERWFQGFDEHRVPVDCCFGSSYGDGTLKSRWLRDA